MSAAFLALVDAQAHAFGLSGAALHPLTRAFTGTAPTPRPTLAEVLFDGAQVRHPRCKHAQADAIMQAAHDALAMLRDAPSYEDDRVYAGHLDDALADAVAQASDLRADFPSEDKLRGRGL